MRCRNPCGIPYLAQEVGGGMVSDGKIHRQPWYIVNLLEGLGGFLAIHPGQHNIQ
ncbi:hypothetical protein D3C87_2083690 [compost metagenome]